MLTFATQTLAEATTIITPEEPATLSLAVVGIGTLAVYGALAGRRRRAAIARVAVTRCAVVDSSEARELVRRAA